MFWKKTGLVCIVLAALAIVAYAQTGAKPRAHSSNLQTALDSGYLGVAFRNLTVDEARVLGLKENSGVKVTIVTQGAPGEKAGIHTNDVILDFNEQKVDDQETLQDSIIAKTPGTKVSLTLLRNGAKQTVMATLGVRPPGLPRTTGPGFATGPLSPEDLEMMIAAQNTVDAPKVGFDGFDLEPQLAEYFGVREGVLVAQVYEKTPADRAGLKAGDVVTKVNGVPVATAREISGVVRVANKKAIAFTVVRSKKEITLNVEIAWNRPDLFDRGAVN